MIELTDSEAASLLDFIDIHLIDDIRNDTDIDSMLWLDNLMSIWRKCGGRKEYADGN